MYKTLLTLFSVLLILPASAFATQVSIPDMNADAGAAVNIPVNVDNALGIAGFQFTITYNTAVLNCSNAIAGSLTDGWTVLANATVPGEIQVGGFNFTTELGAVPGSLTILQCKAKNPGNTPVAFTYSLLANLNSEELQHSNDNGVFTTTGVLNNVVLQAPNGGEIIPSGSTYAITWLAPTTATKFKLSYSMDNGLTWFPIPKTADFITGTNYVWTVPKPLGNKKKCLVKVTGYKANGVKVGSDKSDATFMIEVVKLTSPDGGETLTSGNHHTITWTTNATKPVAKVKLYYSKDGGITWNSICDPVTGKCAFTGNPGSYDWQVPTVSKLKSNYKVKVELTDISKNILGTDKSNSPFTIQPGP